MFFLRFSEKSDNKHQLRLIQNPIAKMVEILKYRNLSWTIFEILKYRNLSGILVDFVGSLAIQSTEGFGYTVKISRAVQPMVSVATLFNTPLSYFSEDEQLPQALLYLNTCSITSVVTLNREETVAVGTHKAILTAQSSYIQALIKESNTVPVTGSAD